MFFIVGNKVYYNRFNEELKVFQEVTLVKEADGRTHLKPLKTGLKEKPANRRICLASEVVAQLGVLAKAEDASGATNAQSASSDAAAAAAGNSKASK
jgi:hypothetical protein